MAFPSAVGYTNLPNGNFSPTIFSKKALQALRKESVVEDITNTDYFGEIANYGDTVRIMREPTITITEYKRGAAVPVQSLNDDDFSITVDQANQFSFSIDDLEAKQSHINFETLASNRAAYDLKDAYDREVLEFMRDSSTSATVGTSSAAVKIQAGVTPSATAFTPLGIMARAKRILDLANVPGDSRYCVADPYFYEQLSDENSKLLNNDYTDKGILRNGKVAEGMVRGYRLYESNNLPVAGTGPSAASGSTNHGVILFGHQSAIATVSQISKTESFRSQTAFADVVRGLHLYGRGVIRPEALVAVYYTVA